MAEEHQNKKDIENVGRKSGENLDKTTGGNVGEHMGGTEKTGGDVGGSSQKPGAKKDHLHNE